MQWPRITAAVAPWPIQLRPACGGRAKTRPHCAQAIWRPSTSFISEVAKATLELAGQMNLRRDAGVLDIGSGLGGPARTLAEEYGCHVTGIDLTPSFCEAAAAMSTWVGLGKRVAFQQADATDLPFADNQFDAAMTIHVAMNIPAKQQMYAEARRVVRPGGIFAVYDVLQ